MLDFLHIADTQSYDLKTFYGLGQNPGASNLTDWVQWTKPRGIKFVYIFGAGGGGSGGGADFASNSAGGGGGGGSGAFTTVLLPEMFVPDVLYVYPGAGGKGLVNGIGTGINGSNSYVAVEPYVNYTANLTLFLANGGGGGGGGTDLAAGAAGVGGAAVTAASMPLCRGNFTSIAGHNGGLGGAPDGGNAPNINFPVTGLMLTGGAGGGGNASGGTGGDGGGIIAPAGASPTYFRSIDAGIRASGNDAATQGGNGYASNNFIQHAGGGGGGGGSSGSNRPGAFGGDAAPGCGGGGSGAGSPSNPTVKGGEGGAGFVVILCW